MPGNPLLKQFGVGLFVVRHHGVVGRVLLGVAFLQLGKIRANVCGNGKRFFVPAIVFTHRFDRVVAQRFAMRACGVGLRRSVRNLRVNDDQRRMLCIRFRIDNCLCNRIRVFAVCHLLYRPAVRFKALADVFCEREVRAALNRDLVAIVKQNQLTKAKVAGERRGFRSDAFHEAAVAGERIGVVIDNRESFAVELGGKARFRHRHADCSRNSLPKRASRGFHAVRMAELRMTRRFAAPLTEVFELFHRQSVAKQVQQRILQHGSMSRGEHKTVSARPVRILRVVLHLLPERKRHRRGADRKTRMSAVRLLNRFRREEANVGNRLLFNRFHESGFLSSNQKI